MFDIKEVKLIQNKVLPVDALITAIQSILVAEKFNFTKLQGKVREQLFDLLNTQGKIREVKNFSGWCLKTNQES